MEIFDLLDEKNKKKITEVYEKMEEFYSRNVEINIKSNSKVISKKYSGNPITALMALESLKRSIIKDHSINAETLAAIEVFIKIQ